MQRDRHVDGESLHGLLRLALVGAAAQSSALATTLRKSVRLVMARLLESADELTPLVGAPGRREAARSCHGGSAGYGDRLGLNGRTSADRGCRFRRLISLMQARQK